MGTKARLTKKITPGQCNTVPSKVGSLEMKLNKNHEKINKVVIKNNNNIIIQSIA